MCGMDSQRSARDELRLMDGMRVMMVCDVRGCLSTLRTSVLFADYIAERQCVRNVCACV